MSQFVDIEELLGKKILKEMPRFVVDYLKKIVHQEDLNAAIRQNPNKMGADFLQPALEAVGINYSMRGEENLPKSGRFVFACNHPLGGPEALIVGEVIRKQYGGDLKFVVNSLLCAMKPLVPLFVPVNTLGGGQNRGTSQAIKKMFASNSQVCLFPAGICARKMGGKITEMPWKKMFVTQAKASQRDIIPVHCTGKNSRWFYFLAKMCQLFHLKFNIAMLYLVDELYKKRGQTFVVTFGEPISWQTLTHEKTDAEWAAEIRGKTMALGEV